jgi:hypothetical protein
VRCLNMASKEYKKKIANVKKTIRYKLSAGTPIRSFAYKKEAINAQKSYEKRGLKSYISSNSRIKGKKYDLFPSPRANEREKWEKAYKKK